MNDEFNEVERRYTDVLRRLSDVSCCEIQVKSGNTMDSLTGVGNTLKCHAVKSTQKFTD